MFDIDTTSSVPIYAQIVEKVKSAVAFGILRQGDALPSLRELSARLRVNPLTISKAYKDLEAGGVVVTEHGRGTFVSENARQLGNAYRLDMLRQAVDRMLVEAYLAGASPEEVLGLVKDKLAEQGVKEHEIDG